MNDEFMEYLVKRKRTNKDKALRFLFIFLTVLSVGLVPLFGTWILFITFGLWLLTTKIIFRNTDVEYEYSYCDRLITVDKILGQAKRKTVGEYPLDSIELIAPVGSHRLDEYKNRNFKVNEYWSLRESDEHKPYEIILSRNEKVILDLPLEFVKMIQNNAPRKVYLD